VFAALVVGVGGLLWYLRKRSKESSTTESKGKKKSETSRSAFKFPEAKKSKGPSGTQAQSSNLPRNKSSNNKKNKARRKVEKAEKAKNKAEKRKAASSGGEASSSKEHQPTTSVINYSYFDTARRDTIIPTHKKPTLSAADVMKKDQESRQNK
jgi:hypothetical protein